MHIYCGVFIESGKSIIVPWESGSQNSRFKFHIFYFLQEQAVKKKYGGIMPKKPPLISKVVLNWK